jgi:mRNA interferase HigB
MTLGGLEIIVSFKKKHPQSRGPLDRWATLMKGVSPKNLIELRQTFGHADLVGNLTVFNIGGGNYRLLAVVSYVAQVAVVNNVLTHAEYDDVKLK